MKKQDYKKYIAFSNTADNKSFHADSIHKLRECIENSHSWSSQTSDVKAVFDFRENTITINSHEYSIYVKGDTK